MEGPVVSAGGGAAPGGNCNLSSGDHSAWMSNLPVKPVWSTTLRPRRRESDGAKSDSRILAALSSPRGLVSTQPHHKVGDGGAVWSGRPACNCLPLTP